MKKIGGVLGRSALGAIKEHMAKVNECIGIFREAQAAYINGSFSEIPGLAKKIDELEHEADLIKESIKRSISRSIFASSNRGDIISIIHKADDIADACQDVVKFLTLHSIKMPSPISEKLKTLTEKTVIAGEILYRAVEQTVAGEESETAPRGNSQIYDMLSGVKLKEWETDEIQIAYVREVFRAGEKLNAPDFFFLMNLGRHTVVIADHMENAADGLQALISG